MPRSRTALSMPMQKMLDYIQKNLNGQWFTSWSVHSVLRGSYSRTLKALVEKGHLEMKTEGDKFPIEHFRLIK